VWCAEHMTGLVQTAREQRDVRCACDDVPCVCARFRALPRCSSPQARLRRSYEQVVQLSNSHQQDQLDAWDRQSSSSVMVNLQHKVHSLMQVRTSGLRAHAACRTLQTLDGGDTLCQWWVKCGGGAWRGYTAVVA
jgi:hypothetical protein